MNRLERCDDLEAIQPLIDASLANVAAALLTIQRKKGQADCCRLDLLNAS